MQGGGKCFTLKFKSLLQSRAVRENYCHLPVPQNFVHVRNVGWPEIDNKNKSVKIKTDVVFSATTHSVFRQRRPTQPQISPTFSSERAGYDNYVEIFSVKTISKLQHENIAKLQHFVS